MEDQPPTAAPAKPLPEYVAEEILAWVARRRMTVAQLARQLGHSNQMQLSRRLNLHTPFDTDELAAIAKILKIKVTDLLPKEPAAKPAESKPLDLDQLAEISAYLGIPPADLLRGSSPWYSLFAQTPDHPNVRPRAPRPISGPPADIVRRPQRRSAALPAAAMTVGAGRL
jgi:transcriptional regulator with XRE-family HTH domain